MDQVYSSNRGAGDPNEEGSSKSAPSSKDGLIRKLLQVYHLSILKEKNVYQKYRHIYFSLPHLSCHSCPDLGLSSHSTIHLKIIWRNLSAP